MQQIPVKKSPENPSAQNGENLSTKGQSSYDPQKGKGCAHPLGRGGGEMVPKSTWGGSTPTISDSYLGMQGWGKKRVTASGTSLVYSVGGFILIGFGGLSKNCLKTLIWSEGTAAAH